VPLSDVDLLQMNAQILKLGVTVQMIALHSAIHRLGPSLFQLHHLLSGLPVSLIPLVYIEEQVLWFFYLSYIIPLLTILQNFISVTFLFLI
jgi:hypothetical protein